MKRTLPTIDKVFRHHGILCACLHKLVLAVTVAALVSACTTTPSPRQTSSDEATPGFTLRGTKPQIRSDASDDPGLNENAIRWSQRAARERGWLYAQAELDSLEPETISENTRRFIQSQLLWLSGDIAASNSELSRVLVSDESELDLILAEQQRREKEGGNPIGAAKIALERLNIEGQLANTAVHSDVFNLLSLASNQQIAAALRRAEPASDWAFWLGLNSRYRQGSRSEFSNWLERYPTLPNGALELPSGLTRWLNSEAPYRIGVLLPLSGNLKSAAESTLNGIVEGLYSSFRNPALRPHLIIIDTEATNSARAAYALALEKGADFVIGPLTKERVSELYSIDGLPVPVLALNRGNGIRSQTPKANSQFISLSLAPEDEAIQLASLMWKDGLRTPLMISPGSAWGQRMRSAFEGAWRSLGGQIPVATILSDDTSDNDSVAQSLATFRSEARIKEMENAFEAPIDSQARRRADLDSVILLTPTPQMAREIRPLLRFHYAGKLPVYAPSTVFQPGQGSANRDLNGIRFIIAPHILLSDPDRSQPLHALGVDAAAFVNHFQQAAETHDTAEETESTFMFGETGNLSLDSMGNVRRRLQPAVFARGQAKPI